MEKYILMVKRLRNDINGNPRKNLILLSGNGRNATDMLFNYFNKKKEIKAGGINVSYYLNDMQVVELLERELNINIVLGGM